MPRPEKLGEGGDFWLTRLFQGEGFYGNPSDKMIILKNGVEVHEVPIEQLNQDTVIGRHPEAHIQLEAYKLGLFHIVLRKKDDRLYVEAIDDEYGTLLNIDGEDVERSYSMSSSPSRPHVLEMTVKRVPGGVVSNWLCDHVKLGQRLTIKGPAGKFSCFNYPAAKMLFVGAGSGITPADGDEPLDRGHDFGCRCQAARLVQIALGHHFPQGTGAHIGAA